MLTDDLFEDVPDFRALFLDKLLGRFDCGGETAQVQLAEDEWFEQLQCHLLRQTALM
jgi:hypothetical protein